MPKYSVDVYFTKTFTKTIKVEAKNESEVYDIAPEQANTEDGWTTDCSGIEVDDIQEVIA